MPVRIGNGLSKLGIKAQFDVVGLVPPNHPPGIAKMIIHTEVIGDGVRFLGGLYFDEPVELQATHGIATAVVTNDVPGPL